MDLHRLNDLMAEMHLKFTPAGVICYMLMLAPTDNFVVDPDQTVPRRTDRQTLRTRFWLLLGE